MASAGTMQVRINVTIGFWDAIKMRIAGIPSKKLSDYLCESAKPKPETLKNVGSSVEVAEREKSQGSTKSGVL